MNKLVVLIAVSLSILGCKKGENKNATSQVEKPGIYEVIFIDVNNTRIPDDIDPKVLKESRLFSNLNLTKSDQFWNSKNNFYAHGMGSIKTQESGEYYFRLTSAGKILFKLNNKDLVKVEELDKKEVTNKSAFLDSGVTVFEFEYFPGRMDPYLVLEWSTDGENYEVVPDNVFSNMDALNVQPWQSDEATTNADAQEDNRLSDAEIKEGWKLLFDGETTKGWHTYNKPGTIGSKWKAENGALVFQGRNRFEFFVAGRKIEIGSTDKVKDGGEDIVSDEAFENFELNLEWKISKGGNNGLFYTVKEMKEYDEIWKTSPEMQVMDNNGHKDGLIYKHRAGDLYDLIASVPLRAKPYGNWNKVRIIKNNGKIEHWLNGSKVVSYDLNTEEWKELLSKSKFAEYKDFASPGPGKIGFQDHDNKVHYKNIKIKEIK